MGLKSWWDSLWEGNQNVDEDGLPRITETIPMPEVKPCKPEKDISEPVLSFVEVYKANPKRFRVKKEYFQEDGSYTFKYTIYDKEGNKTFSVCKTGFYTYCGEISWIAMTNTKWATQDEIQFVYDTVFNERCDRRKVIMGTRSKVQRERLTKLYKGE